MIRLRLHLHLHHRWNLRRWRNSPEPISYVEGTRVIDDGVEVSPQSGQMHLRPEGNSWLITLEFEDREPEGYSGPTWSANATTLTFIESDSESSTWGYTLEGKFLTITYVHEQGATLEKWRKD